MATMTRLLAAACVLSVALAGQAGAAPSISSTSGTFQHGNSVTISGSSFGTKSPAAPVLWDTIDNQSAYSSLGDGDPIPVTTGYPWSSNGTPWTTDVEYCTSRPMRGQEIAHYYETVRGFLGWPRAMSTQVDNDNQQIYVNWWWRPSSDPQGPGGSNKMIRIWDRNSGTDTRISWTTMHMTYEGTPYPSWVGWGGNPGQWNHQEIWVDANNNTIKAWTNGNLRHNISDFAKVNNGIGLNVCLVGFDASESSRYPDLQLDMGDIYIDITQARVVLGNAATYSNCDHTEIQIPTAWSAGSVTVTVNQGSFANGAPVYLYVVDADGNANSAGYPVTIGGPIMYNLSVTNGSGDGQYEQDAVVAISADAAPSGKAFGIWVGDSATVVDVHAAGTTVTMPSADVSVIAAYVWVYQLTVNSGTGDGSYTAGTVVDIAADAAPSGQAFDAWTGDVADVADTLAAVTTVTMPPVAVEITATYKPIAIPGDLDGDGFVGQDDLDIVLDQWGCGDPPADPITDSRADPSGDGFVGQDDLDIVLDHWGEGLPR